MGFLRHNFHRLSVFDEVIKVGAKVGAEVIKVGAEVITRSGS